MVRNNRGINKNVSKTWLRTKNAYGTSTEASNDKNGDRKLGQKGKQKDRHRAEFETEWNGKAKTLETKREVECGKKQNRNMERGNMEYNNQTFKGFVLNFNTVDHKYWEWQIRWG